MRSVERVVWVALALGAFVAGFGSRRCNGGGGTSSLWSGGDAGSKLPVHSQDAEAGNMAGMTASQKAVLVERTALASPLRTGRFMGMMAALDQVKPGTWQPMWEEFKRQTTEDGRVHEVEWGLFMNRVGEVDGPDAMAFFEKNGQPEETFNRREILRGWAAADPEAAIRWMDAQPADSPNQELQQTLLAGVVQANPETALNLMAKAPDERSRQMADDFVNDLIQAKGVQWTMDRLVKLRADNDPPPAYVTQLLSQMGHRVDRMSWLAGNDDAVTTWQSKISPGGQTAHEGPER